MERVKALSCWGAAAPQVRPAGEVREELQLGEGRTNQNFIVDAEGRRYFVRIGNDLPFYMVSREREHAASRAAMAAGVAPAVLHTELPDALVVEFAAGRALTEDDLHSAAASRGSPLLREVTRVIHRLHATAMPPQLEELAAKGAGGWGGPHFAKWLAYAEEQGYKRLPLLDGLRDFIGRLEEVAAECVGAGAAAPAPCFCHFDLLADNFVLQPSGEILLVDFEYAAPGQPLMDLAVLAMGCDLDAAEERNLLSSYLATASGAAAAAAGAGGAAGEDAEREATEEELRGFRALRTLAALRETFWGVTGELSQSCALSPEEARQYVDKNYEKFLKLRADFEREDQRRRGPAPGVA